MQDSLTNQTQFSQEEPYLERQIKDVPKDVVKEAPPKTEEVAPSKPPLSTRMKILISSSGFLVALLLLLLVSSRNGSKTPTIEPEPTIMPTAVPAAANPLLDRVESLKAAHDTADPSENDLSFPPVSMDLRLDPLVRR